MENNTNTSSWFLSFLNGSLKPDYISDDSIYSELKNINWELDDYNDLINKKSIKDTYKDDKGNFNEFLFKKEYDKVKDLYEVFELKKTSDNVFDLFNTNETEKFQDGGNVVLLKSATNISGKIGKISSNYVFDTGNYYLTGKTDYQDIYTAEQLAKIGGKQVDIYGKQIPSDKIKESSGWNPQLITKKDGQFVTVDIDNTVNLGLSVQSGFLDLNKNATKDSNEMSIYGSLGLFGAKEKTSELNITNFAKKAVAEGTINMATGILGSVTDIARNSNIGFINYLDNVLDAGKVKLSEEDESAETWSKRWWYNASAQTIGQLAGIITAGSIASTFGASQATISRITNGAFSLYGMNGIGDRLREAGYDEKQVIAGQIATLGLLTQTNRFAEWVTKGLTVNEQKVALDLAIKDNLKPITANLTTLEKKLVLQENAEKISKSFFDKARIIYKDKVAGISNGLVNEAAQEYTEGLVPELVFESQEKLNKIASEFNVDFKLNVNNKYMNENEDFLNNIYQASKNAIPDAVIGGLAGGVTALPVSLLNKNSKHTKANFLDYLTDRGTNFNKEEIDAKYTEAVKVITDLKNNGKFFNNNLTIDEDLKIKALTTKDKKDTKISSINDLVYSSVLNDLNTVYQNYRQTFEEQKGNEGYQKVYSDFVDWAGTNDVALDDWEKYKFNFLQQSTFKNLNTKRLASILFANDATKELALNTTDRKVLSSKKGLLQLLNENESNKKALGSLLSSSGLEIALKQRNALALKDTDFILSPTSVYDRKTKTKTTVQPSLDEVKNQVNLLLGKRFGSDVVVDPNTNEETLTNEFKIKKRKEVEVEELTDQQKKDKQILERLNKIERKKQSNNKSFDNKKTSYSKSKPKSNKKSKSKSKFKFNKKSKSTTDKKDFKIYLKGDGGNQLRELRSLESSNKKEKLKKVYGEDFEEVLSSIEKSESIEFKINTSKQLLYDLLSGKFNKETLFMSNLFSQIDTEKSKIDFDKAENQIKTKDLVFFHKTFKDNFIQNYTYLNVTTNEDIVEQIELKKRIKEEETELRKQIQEVFNKRKEDLQHLITDQQQIHYDKQFILELNELFNLYYELSIDLGEENQTLNTLIELAEDLDVSILDDTEALGNIIDDYFGYFEKINLKTNFKTSYLNRINLEDDIMSSSDETIEDEIKDLMYKAFNFFKTGLQGEKIKISYNQFQDLTLDEINNLNKEINSDFNDSKIKDFIYEIELRLAQINLNAGANVKSNSQFKVFEPVFNELSNLAGNDNWKSIVKNIIKTNNVVDEEIELDEKNLKFATLASKQEFELYVNNLKEYLENETKNVKEANKNNKELIDSLEKTNELNQEELDLNKKEFNELSSIKYSITNRIRTINNNLTLPLDKRNPLITETILDVRNLENKLNDLNTKINPLIKVIDNLENTINSSKEKIDFLSKEIENNLNDLLALENEFNQKSNYQNYTNNIKNDLESELKNYLKIALEIKQISDNNLPDYELLRLAKDTREVSNDLIDLKSYIEDFNIKDGENKSEELIKSINVELEKLEKLVTKNSNGIELTTQGVTDNDLLNGIKLVNQAYQLLHIYYTKGNLDETKENKLVKYLKDNQHSTEAEVIEKVNTLKSIVSVDQANYNSLFSKLMNTQIAGAYFFKSKFPSYLQQKYIRLYFGSLKTDFVSSDESSNNFSNFSFLQGIQGSGKTQVVLKYITNLYGLSILPDLESTNEIQPSRLSQSITVVNVNPDVESTKNLRDDIFGTPVENKIDNFTQLLENLDDLEKGSNDIKVSIDNFRLIVIDEATLITKKQLETLQELVVKLNIKSGNKIKVIFSGDVKQVSAEDGLIGIKKLEEELQNLTYDELVIDKKINTEQLYKPFYDSFRNMFKLKELNFTRRTGIKTISDTINYFRNKDIERYTSEQKILSYYEKDGIERKGLQFVENSKENYNAIPSEVINYLNNFKDNVKIAGEKKELLIITCSSKDSILYNSQKEQLEKVGLGIFNEKQFLTVEEAQGKTTKRVVVLPLLSNVYDDSDKKNVELDKLQTDIAKRNNNNYKRDEAGNNFKDPTIYNYRLRQELVSSIGRATDFAMIVTDSPTEYESVQDSKKLERYKISNNSKNLVETTTKVLNENLEKFSFNKVILEDGVVSQEENNANSTQSTSNTQNQQPSENNEQSLDNTNEQTIDDAREKLEKLLGKQDFGYSSNLQYPINIIEININPFTEEKSSNNQFVYFELFEEGKPITSLDITNDGFFFDKENLELGRQTAKFSFRENADKSITKIDENGDETTLICN